MNKLPKPGDLFPYPSEDYSVGISSGLDRLPTELLDDICIHLSHQALDRLARTCKDLYEKVQPAIYRHLGQDGRNDVLDWACWKGRFATARSAVRFGAQINRAGPYAVCPLHQACRRQGDRDKDLSLELIEWLVERGADPNALDYRGYTALHYATEERVVMALLKGGADSSIRGERSPSVLCAMLDDYNSPMASLAAMRCLLQQDGVDANDAGYANSTPLITALHARHEHSGRESRAPDYIKLLLEHGADPNLLSDWDRQHPVTPRRFPPLVQVATYLRHGDEASQVSRLLLQHGAEAESPGPGDSAISVTRPRHQ